MSSNSTVLTDLIALLYSSIIVSSAFSGIEKRVIGIDSKALLRIYPHDKLLVRSPSTTIKRSIFSLVIFGL
jgi:hypothetical protein